MARLRFPGKVSEVSMVSVKSQLHFRQTASIGARRVWGAAFEFFLHYPVVGKDLTTHHKLNDRNLLERQQARPTARNSYRRMNSRVEDKLINGGDEGA